MFNYLGTVPLSEEYLETRKQSTVFLSIMYIICTVCAICTICTIQSQIFKAFSNLKYWTI